MNDPTSRAPLALIAPFFIVREVPPAIAFYRDRLGFELMFQTPADEPFFAMLRRDSAALMLKAVGDGVLPLANSARHPVAKWDAYVYTPDPDGLCAEFTARGVAFCAPLGDTEDRLRGFELADPDGYVLFFGRPL
jgi:catechol 2,3-dioxygenase-like lactoylglutathione lyase family enzyme